jgi:hypothetical protein
MMFCQEAPSATRAMTTTTSVAPSTTSLLLAHGATATLMAGLVDCRLVTATSDRIMAGQRSVDVMRVRITDAGRAVLEP